MPKTNKDIENQLQLRENSRFLYTDYAGDRKVENRFFNDNPIVGSLVLYKSRLYLLQLIQFLKKTTIIIPNYLYKLASTSYSVFLNVIPSTTYDAGELSTVGYDQFIITRYPKKKLFNRSIINRESITILEAVSANSFAYLPLIILSVNYINNTLAY
ncbi:hypothetical protein N7472_003622 [Penicillium cf. griseofulvum]|uniref:Uncharacterized protein n=1 Tax=Penicillium cf. griseofulvum TaxID=2972120 RepID=A0A9W9MTN0_9EURO|nr:hypothetical protein N7472_003622 [Penicillium cf. griseofulvum]KAJ5447853.1 hypothetical protein N7445_002674 [Penicillium cf. griseofulvum]